MAYHFLEHTADEKFAAEGKTLEETFSFAAQAFKEAVCGKITVLEQETKPVEIKGDNLENLLYKFLEEFIFLLDSEDFLFSQVKDLKIDKEKFILTANITGDKGENYKFTNDVKAVTYNEMFVKFNKEKNIWECQAVLDV